MPQNKISSARGARTVCFLRKKIWISARERMGPLSSGPVRWDPTSRPSPYITYNAYINIYV